VVPPEEFFDEVWLLSHLLARIPAPGNILVGSIDDGESNRGPWRAGVAQFCGMRVSSFHARTGSGRITADCAVNATFARAVYKVTPAAGAHGTIAPNTPQFVG